MIKAHRTIVLTGLFLAMTGTVYGQESKSLPFPDGRYVVDKNLCRMSENQMVENYGDMVGAMVRIIKGRNISNAYESSCDISKVRKHGAMLSISVLCDAEGHKEESVIEYIFISKNSFSDNGEIFSRCTKQKL